MNNKETTITDSYLPFTFENLRLISTDYVDLHNLTNLLLDEVFKGMNMWKDDIRPFLIFCNTDTYGRIYNDLSRYMGRSGFITTQCKGCISIVGVNNVRSLIIPIPTENNKLQIIPILPQLYQGIVALLQYNIK